jgi:ubiquinone/menaquinone biosynthesis C-methylase UbiE
MFGQTWSWSQEGDEWSAPWGGTAALWWGSLFPRVRPFLPTETILEIAPGHGRITQFLKDYCHRLVLVDLAEGCIEACRRRFSACSHIEYHVNDGYSLDAVADRSVDFVFSFDSLVHAEADVIRAYVLELARKLKPDSVGFLHHSNLGSYPRAVFLARAVPSARVQALLRQAFLPNLGHWRSATHDRLSL